MVRPVAVAWLAAASLVAGQDRSQKDRLKALRRQRSFPSPSAALAARQRNATHQSSRTRAWPPPRLLEPLLPATDRTELAAVRTGKVPQAIRAPGCPDGTCASKGSWLDIGKRDGSFFPNEPPEEWLPPGARVGHKKGDATHKNMFQKEWGMFMVLPYAEHFAAGMVAALRDEWRELLDDFIQKEFHRGAPPRGAARRGPHDRVHVVGVHFRLGNGEKFARMPTNHTHVVLRAAAGVKKVAAQLGYDRFRVLVATDDPWRPPAGAGIVFSSWRVKEVDKDKSVAAQKEMTGSADACLRNSADMLIDSSWATRTLVLPVPSTFTVLPKVMAHSRGAPYCAFLGRRGRAGLHEAHRHPLPKDAKTGHASDWTVAVEPQGRASALGATFWH
ncbi:hypothetical protein JL720_3291 [Aureococcus anophagefferens]|nr:hypothetical protein JL720_3291 [Aureococcus anophagefferens]